MSPRREFASLLEIAGELQGLTNDAYAANPASPDALDQLGHRVNAVAFGLWLLAIELDLEAKR